MDGHMNELMDEQTGRTNGRTYERTGERTDWEDGWTDGCDILLPWDYPNEVSVPLQNRIAFVS